MKKKSLITTGILFLSLISNAQTKVTNNPVLIVNSGNSATCNSSGVITTDNSIFQLYDLDDYSNLTDTGFIVRMLVACEETSGGAYNIVGAVHRISGTVNIANITFVDDDTVAIYPDSTLYRIAIPFDNGGYVLPGDSLMCELKLPTNATASYYPGSNTSPEIRTTYFVAAGCSINDFTPVADIGFPNMHLIMNLYLNQKPSVNNSTFSLFKDEELDFTATDFINQFVDNDGDGLNMIKLTTIPANGLLDLSGTSLSVGDTVLTSELDMLKYIPNAGYSGSDQFSYVVRDSSHWSNSSADADITVYNWQLGLLEMEKAELTLYPNPSNDIFNIDVQGTIHIVRIFDASGKLVLQTCSDNVTVDMSAYEAGIYFVEVTTSESILTSTLVLK